MEYLKVPHSRHDVPQKKRRAAAEKKPDFDWLGATYPRLSPGVYTVVGKSYQGPEKIASFGRWGIRIEFDTLSGEGPVSLFLNLGRKEKPHFGPASNYYRYWCEANGGPPDRGEAMTPDIFLDGQIFEVEVDDARLSAKKEQKADHLIYSRVAKLLKVVHTGNEKCDEAVDKQEAESKKHAPCKQPKHASTQAELAPLPRQHEYAHAAANNIVSIQASPSPGEGPQRSTQMLPRRAGAKASA